MAKHILDTRQLKDRKFIEGFIKKTSELKNEVKRGNCFSHHNGKIVCGLFYEPSTRTRTSFEAAAARLGAEPVFTENASEFSSAFKGETLEHGIMATQENYEALIVRHPESFSAERAAKVSKKPVINAGDGCNQHPTQALLDIYTIHEKFGTMDNLKIGFLGDLKNGRTVKSLTYLLSHCDNNEFFYASPKSLSLPDEISKYLNEKNINTNKTNNVVDFLKDVDVLYVTRIQQERMEKGYEEMAKNYDNFIIDMEKADMMKDSAIIMHPLPINREKSHNKSEISPEVDSHPKAWYFYQSGNGMYARMALLDIILKGEKDPLYNLILDHKS